MSILSSKYFLFAGFFIAILLPFSLLTISVANTWWLTYVSWVAFFMQSFLMLTAALLTYRAAFHKKVLGGELGIQLRIFSIGLSLLGLGLTQIPFIEAYDLWNTDYVRGGLYFVLYILGGLMIVFSLVMGTREKLKRAFAIIAVVFFVGVVIRFMLEMVPLHKNTYFVTVSSYRLGLTIDTVMLCIILAFVSLGWLYRNLFRNSKIGKIFRLQVAGFAWYFIPIISDFLGETVPGWNNWYTYSLGGIVLFAGSLLLAAVFFYRMGLYIDKLQLA